TLEELLEAITLKRLGLFTKPIIIVNINQYYDPLIEMLEKCISEHFMSEQHRQMWTVIEDTSRIIEAIHSAPSWENGA
ncbi:LOG family protein, partial [Staphylococcus aureus]